MLGQVFAGSGRYSSPWYAAFVAPEVGNAMATAGSSFFTLPDRPPLGPSGSEGRPIVVRLCGEHDVSTDRALCLTLARAIALDSAGLVLDLSEVELIGSSTLEVIVRARQFLSQRSASLTVRSPSPFARETIDACGLSDLLCPNPEMAGSQQGTALSSWAEGASQAVNPERLRGAVRESGRCGALHSSSTGGRPVVPRPLLGGPSVFSHTALPLFHPDIGAVGALFACIPGPWTGPGAPGRPMSFPR